MVCPCNFYFHDKKKKKKICSVQIRSENHSKFHLLHDSLTNCGQIELGSRLGVAKKQVFTHNVKDIFFYKRRFKKFTSTF